MRTAADTSLIVASFASWHDHHAVAADALASVDLVIAHSLVETYSVLTRLPAPHRVDAETAATYLRLQFGRHRVAGLTPAQQRKVVDACAHARVIGGSVYDALIATAAVAANARLLTLDGRARATYAALGATYELVV